MAKNSMKPVASAITIQNDTVREQTRQLLMGLGIRTLRCDGVNRCSGFVGAVGEKPRATSFLSRTALRFWRQIGFVQPISFAPEFCGALAARESA